MLPVEKEIGGSTEGGESSLATDDAEAEEEDTQAPLTQPDRAGEDETGEAQHCKDAESRLKPLDTHQQKAARESTIRLRNKLQSSKF